MEKNKEVLLLIYGKEKLTGSIDVGMIQNIQNYQIPILLNYLEPLVQDLKKNMKRFRKNLNINEENEKSRLNFTALPKMKFINEQLFQSCSFGGGK